MPKTRMKDLVVLLPGIMGSALQKDGKDLWDVSGQAIAQALKTLGGALDQLILEADDPEADDLGDGIRASRVLPDATFIPKLAKIDGYTAISRMITDNFIVVRGKVGDPAPANYYEFPYDWRRHNRSTALKLHRFLDDSLARWRQYTHNPKAKVIFLAHSMGGLVCRYYLEVLGGWADCRALITFGTPYRGSLNALDCLSNGLTKAAGLVHLSTLVRSCTSVYQLLPIYPVVLANRQWQYVHTTELPNVDRTRAVAARAFHDAILQAVDKEPHSNASQGGYLLLPIVGTEQETLQSAELQGGRVVLSQELPAPVVDQVTQSNVLEGGDGTVPRLSAIPIELSASIYLLDFVPQKHGSLQVTPQVLGQLCERLRQMQVQGLENLRVPDMPETPLVRPGIRLSLADLFEHGQEVTLQAQLVHVAAAPGKLKAHIQPVQPGGAVVEHELHERAGIWSVHLGELPAGMYRAAVFTERRGPDLPMPVQDLFEVLP